MRNFQIWPILLSKYVNNVCKLLRLLGDFVPRPPTAASPLDHTGGLLSPQNSWTIAPLPQIKILGGATANKHVK